MTRADDGSAPDGARATAGAADEAGSAVAATDAARTTDAPRATDAPLADDAPPTDDGPQADDATPHPPARRPWLRPLGWALGVLGLLCIGLGAGQLLLPATVVAEQDAAPPFSGELPAQAEDDVVVLMPDVLGLDEATSARVLSDAGVSSEVNLVTMPAAGPEGVVVAQDPPAGTKPDGQVTLTVSETVTMPDVVGATSTSARADLHALGAVVQIGLEVDPTRPSGTILRSDPPAGEPLGTVVTLVVADAGQGLSIADLRNVEGRGCRTLSSGTVNGTPVQDSIRCMPDEDDVATSTWVLARQGAAVEALVGVADNGGTGSARVVVYGDDTVLADVTAAYGASSVVRADVRDVLRLRVEVTLVEGEPTVVLGDARVLGTEAQIAAIQGAQ